MALTGFSRHKDRLIAAGFERFGDRPDGAPKEIPMHGMGLFSCRKSAWLEHGGFNPRFRGFGGEEGYIHKKVPQAGHRTLCLPYLKWLHRFGWPRGVPYRLQRLDKLRNYLLGCTELRLDIAPVREHFLDSGLVSRADWDSALRIAALCPAYRRPKLLAEMLECWKAQDHAAELRRLFILDDGGTFEPQVEVTWELQVADIFWTR